MTSSQCVYESRSHKNKRGIDLISDELPFDRLWYIEVSDAIELPQRTQPNIEPLMPRC
jgi:hypothetical protein